MPKLGCITGSRFSDMMTQGRGKALWGKTSTNLAIRIAAERLKLIELDLDGYTSPHMEWGNEQEELAMAVYEQKTFTEVHGQQQYQQHPKLEFVGCTPDGLVGDDVLIEVKNPKTENHLLHMINGDQVDQYKSQIQGSLWVTGRDYCDFVSHDSRVKQLNIKITRVGRNEEYIQQIEDRYYEFEKKVEHYKERLMDLLDSKANKKELELA